MKICIMSDSHGRMTQINQILKRESELDLLLHAGDHADDVANLTALQVLSVSGNCDDPASAPTERTFQLGGLQIFMTHGHLYRVKEGILRLLYRAKEVGAEIVVFGHSHIPIIVEEEGILFLNPGSLSYPRGGLSLPTYAMMDVESRAGETKITIQHHAADGNRLEKFSLTKTF